MSKSSVAATNYVRAVEKLERAQSWMDGIKNSDGMFHVKVSWSVGCVVPGYELLSAEISSLAELRLRRDLDAVIDDLRDKVDHARRELAEEMREETSGRV